MSTTAPAVLLPSHVVLFEEAEVLRAVEPFLRRHRFQRHFRHAHSHFSTDRALQPHIAVWRRPP